MPTATKSSSKKPKPPSPNRDLEAIQELTNSRGWQLVLEEIDRQLKDYVLHLTRNGEVTLDEVHYRRGAAYACAQFPSLPSIIAQRVKSAHSLDKARAAEER